MKVWGYLMSEAVVPRAAEAMGLPRHVHCPDGFLSSGRGVNRQWSSPGKQEKGPGIECRVYAPKYNWVFHRLCDEFYKIDYCDAGLFCVAPF